MSIIHRWQGPDPLPHTDWCARGHRCNLAEHRSDPETYAIPGGHIVLTRVLGRTGEWVEMLGVTRESYESIVRRLSGAGRWTAPSDAAQLTSGDVLRCSNPRLSQRSF
jgi:hypothetical protein